MAVSVKVIKVGNSVGVVLPKDVVEKLNVAQGDTLNITETKYGVNLTPHDADYIETMKIAERIMQEDREVLKKLAES